MNDHDLEQQLRAWYRVEIGERANAPVELRTENATLALAAETSRRPLLARWTFPRINRFASIAFAGAAVVLAVLIGINQLMPRTPDVGPPVSPIPTVSPRSTVQPTPSAGTSLAPRPVLEGRLLFSRRSEARGTWTGMFTIVPDGSDEQPVPLPSPEGGGRWSTSGLEIAVPTTLPDGRIGTAILAADGIVLRVLGIPDPTLNVACTVWSPDDTRLACEGWDDTDPSRRGIYAVSSVDGSDLLRLTEPPSGSEDFFPGDISIDGQLVFATKGALWLVPLAGGQPVPLATETYEDPGRFSPDGLLIATSVRGQLVILDRDGAVIYQPNTQGRSEFGPDWSPDGDWIVFSSGIRGPFADLYISHPDGTTRFVVKATADNEIAVDWGRLP